MWIIYGVVKGSREPPQYMLSVTEECGDGRSSKAVYLSVCAIVDGLHSIAGGVTRHHVSEQLCECARGRQ